MPKYKNPPTLYSTDIYKAISENSENLTIPQVKECFEIYADLVERLAKSKHREKGFIIPLPKLGSAALAISISLIDLNLDILLIPLY